MKPKNELSDYGQFHSRYMGQEARYKGAVVCKSQAYYLTKAGRGNLITWLDKPGWRNGELVDKTMHYHYLNRVFF